MAFFTTSDLTNLYYEDQGSGQPFVLMHGGYANRCSWTPTVKFLLEKGFRVITFDGRGHGASDKPERGYTMDRWSTDLEELMAYLELDGVILLGYSWSVHVMFNYIRLFGCGRLSKIITIDMSPKWISDENWKGGFLKGTYTYADAWEFLHKMECGLYEPFLEFNRQCASADPVPEGYCEVGAGVADLCAINFAKSLWIELVRGDYLEMLHTITVPALIVYGDPGSLYSSVDAEGMKERIPDATLWPVKGGHEFYYMPGGPEQLHAGLVQFLSL